MTKAELLKKSEERRIDESLAACSTCYDWIARAEAMGHDVSDLKDRADAAFRQLEGVKAVAAAYSGVKPS